jgi:hypothetical protein
MGLCSCCTQHIRQLRPQDHLSSGPRNLQVELNANQLNLENACFICAKFARWLEGESQEDSLRRWRTSNLPVQISLVGQICVPGTRRKEVLLPSRLEICRTNPTPNEPSFSVDLAFVHYQSVFLYLH